MVGLLLFMVGAVGADASVAGSASSDTAGSGLRPKPLATMRLPSDDPQSGKREVDEKVRRLGEASRWRGEIDKLAEENIPEAISRFRAGLMDPDSTQEMRRQALLALGGLGTEEAAEAVSAFEDWAEQRADRVWRNPSDGDDEPLARAMDHLSLSDLTALFSYTDTEENRWTMAAGGGGFWIFMAERGEQWTHGVPLIEGRPLLDEWLPEAIQGDMVVESRGTAGRYLLKLGQHELPFSFDAQVTDTDKDGLSDAVEHCLGTDPQKQDSDGDGVPDRRDANPLAPPLDAPDDVAAIRQALFTFHVATSNDCTAVVVARGEDESLQEYRGYAGYTLASRGGRKGFANIVRIDVNIESPTQATVDYGEWHGIVHGFGFHARLKKVGGKWLIILHRNTWVS